MNFKNKVIITIGELKYILALLMISSVMYSCGGSSKGSDITTDDPEKAYFAAKSNYDKQDYLDAIDDFNLIKLKFSGSSIIDKAVYYLGMSYYKRGDYILAVYEFESLVKNYPTSSFAEDASYYDAMCYYRLSPAYNLDQAYSKYAITAFQNYLEFYPKGKHAVSSEKKIEKLRNKLALKELKSGEQYYSLGNYKSSIVYFNNVLEEYFDTKYADDALYGKIQALIAKKQYEAAKQEIERFVDKFSSSEHLSSVISLKNKIPI